MLELLKEWIVNQGLDLFVANLLARSLIFVGIIVASFVAYYLAKKLILKMLDAIISRTTTQWDDMMVKNKVFNRISLLAPTLVMYVTISIPFVGYDWLITLLTGLVVICIIAISAMAVDAFLNAALAIYGTYEISNRIPIKGFIQVLKIIIYFTSGLFVISILINKTPIYLFSSLGAITAILMFIFKDAILGFVAGIQLAANQMVSNGDWIEMPKYGANGNIIEIALTTVKVQNWDQTITTIPTYALITESFKNWRGMSESGGRRIMRSICINMNSIKFCTPDMLARYSKIQHIAGYLKKKNQELAESNAIDKVDYSNPVNGRRMTNIGTFRAYVQAYLHNHPMINTDMTFLIRQLPPSENGLPIEIYVFCRDQEWANYEDIQANIFDHILAIVPAFDLQVFQNPSGLDFNKWASAH